MIDFNEYCKSIHGRRLTSYLLVIGPFEVNINVEPLDEVGSEIRLQCYGANVCKVIQKVMKIVASRSVQSKAQIASARSSSRYHSQALLHGLNAAALFLHAIAQQPPFFHLFFFAWSPFGIQSHAAPVRCFSLPQGHITICCKQTPCTSWHASCSSQVSLP